MAKASKYVWEAILVHHRPGGPTPAKALHGTRAAALTAMPDWARGMSPARGQAENVEVWRTADATFSIIKREVIYATG